MSAEGEFRHVIAFTTGNLDQHGGIVEIGIGHRHAQFDIAAAAPAARPHEDELTFGQNLVQMAHRPADGHHLVGVRHFTVAVGIDINDVGDIGDAAVGDVAIGRKQHKFGGTSLGIGDGFRSSPWLCGRHCRRYRC